MSTNLGFMCRHFKPREFLLGRGDGSSSCACGHPIRDRIEKATGSDVGMIYKTPCRPGAQRAFECPDYSPKTPEEILAEHADLETRFERVFSMFDAARDWRSEMIAANVSHTVKDCPCCGGEQTVRVGCAIGYNNHMRVICDACGAGFIE
jgi:hypothetical protein